MTTPMDEKEGFSFPAFEPNHPAFAHNHTDTAPIAQGRRESDEDGTLTGSGEHTDHHIDDHEIDGNHLRVETSYTHGPDHLNKHARGISPRSPSAAREESRRLDDDLEMLRAERAISAQSAADDLSRSRSLGRSRSRNAGGEPVDDFDIDTTPIHEKTKVYQPPAHPSTKVAKLFKKIHNSSWLVRYFCYIIPVTLLLLIPLLLGALLFESANIGGVELLWFSIWLEIIWLTLWAGRILAKCIPYPLGMVSSLFANNSKKWRDLGKALEVPATLFFWWLAIEISFLPTMKNHHIDGKKGIRSWEATVNKIIVAVFVGCVLNFIEKIVIQLIAISFHLRTYADRIEINKFQIASLVKLYIYSKEKIAMEDSEFEHNNGGPSGVRTPMAYVNKVGKNARTAFTKVGDVAGKVAGDFTGRAVVGSTHPHQVILQLLNSTSGSQVLARRLYRTFCNEESETVLSDDLRPAFDNDEEADAAFTMFDKDLNGDISMEELEAVCVEIGRERKAITASLKDLDSVVSKLDDVLVFVVIVITILVFISLISASASTALTSAGSSVLALSWLFSATAQEFLQSLIFVFVKHPFDVGDRVHIYGNTGSALTGDDYFVKEIALLYTEFKKMEGHVVQAPNSYLNTLFILNQRRSGGLAEAVPVTIKFGTTLEQIESLRNRLVEFVTCENREYQKNVLTELTTIYEAHSISLNVVFFYKSSWQNESLRLQRRNKFICALMVSMQELGIEGPRMRLAGQTENVPLFLSGAYPAAQTPGLGPEGVTPDGPGPRSGSLARDESFVPDVNSSQRQPSIHGSNHGILRHRNSNQRMRGESIGQMGKRVDFSLGMSSMSSGADFGDVYDDPKPRLPTFSVASPGRERNSHDASDHGSLGRIASRDSARTGMSSDQGSTRTHRNRFFNRGRSRLGHPDEGTDMEDLEAGVRTFTAADMPDIPEASGLNTAVNETPVGRPRRGTVDGAGLTTLDARSGMVSSQAIAEDDDVPQARNFRRSMTHK